MDARQMKIKAAEAALSHVQDGMRLGIGTGSTAEEFVRLLAEKVAAGVPTSERTARLCVELGVPLKSLDELPELDLTIDGADEVDHALRLVKGGGGALLREKIVAAASARMIVIADQSKVVETLGAFPLPIEINPFGQVATRIAIEKLASRSGLSGALTMQALARELNTIPGVVEHGLFINLASLAIIAGPEGARVMQAV
ncbi:Ribose-5-phosphate isomerase A [Aphelenchoides besseyi]|nr:Ribose-5-phosphate isomerase A [Aphelenchoides besseyi]